MRELSIPYTEVMVKSVLQNLKTMTRRTGGLEKINENTDKCEFLKFTDYGRCQIAQFKTPESTFYGCLPKYQVGDHLWVRESYYAYGFWINTGDKTPTGLDKYKFVDITLAEGYKYVFESKYLGRVLNLRNGNIGWFKRLGRYMPKAAARIWLEVTDVKCERLQSISTEDCIAEGILPLAMSAAQLAEQGQKYFDYSKPKQFFSDGLDPFWSFNSLWCSINGCESWDANPWVFVYEFKIIEK